MLAGNVLRQLDPMGLVTLPSHPWDKGRVTDETSASRATNNRFLFSPHTQFPESLGPSLLAYSS